MADPRRNDLAKIHIARKDLSLDDGTYRDVIRNIGGAESGSSSDLTATGRAKVLAHFQSRGWKPKRGNRARRRPSADKHPLMASDAQIRKIRALWICLADAGVVKARDEDGLRAWVRSMTRRTHPSRTGYHAVEFLPAEVASQLIEALKEWAGRCGVEYE